MHQVTQLAHVVRPGIIAQAILRGDAEAPERQAIRIDHAVDLMTQQIRHVLGVLAQRRHAYDEHVQVRQQIAAQCLTASALLDPRLRRGQDAGAEGAAARDHRGA